MSSFNIEGAHSSSHLVTQLIKPNTQVDSICTNRGLSLTFEKFGIIMIIIIITNLVVLILFFVMAIL